MENLKQEAIKKAYGEHWETVKDEVDECGWVNLSFAVRANIGIIGNKTYQFSRLEKGRHAKCRIISLRDLENNNGWTKVDEKTNLLASLSGHFVFTDKMNVYVYEHYSYFMSINEMENITHYQPINKPQPPIY